MDRWVGLDSDFSKSSIRTIIEKFPNLLSYLSELSRHNGS